MSWELNPLFGKKYLIIYNPHSGREKKNDQKKQIIDFFTEKNINFKIIEVEVEQWKKMDEEIIRHLEKWPEAVLTVVGGDGTLRRVMQFQHFFSLNLPLSFIPIGSANITAHSLGIPTDINKALLKTITGRIEKFDLGILNDRFVFFIAAGFGKIAELSIKPSRQEKKHLGVWAYLKNSVYSIRKGKKYSFTLEIDGYAKNITDSTGLIIFNHFKFLFFNAKHKIIPNDGRLDLLIISANSFFSYILTGIDFMLKKNNSQRLIRYRAKNIKISGENFNGMIHVDGQHKKINSNEFEIKIIPSAVNLIV